jgi:hypothetical protein
MRSADLETSSSIPGRRGAAISTMDLKQKVETVGASFWEFLGQGAVNLKAFWAGFGSFDL